AADVSAEVIRQAEALQHPVGIAFAESSAAFVQTLKGDWASSLLILKKISRAIQTAGLVVMTSQHAARMAWVLAQLGEAEEAMNHVHQGAELLSNRSYVGTSGIEYSDLGRACLILDRVDEAQRFGERGVKLLPKYPGFQARALHLLGDIAAYPER